MSRRVGLELTRTRVRAVVVGGLRSAPVVKFELEWNPAIPEDAVALLRQHLGKVSSIGIAVGIEFTHVKRLSLPPVPAEDRRAIVALEPDRYFPVALGEAVVAVFENSDLVFAADASRVGAWITSFQAWAPVETVLAAPDALARALRVGGISSGKFELGSADDAQGYAEIRNGSLADARRMPPGEHADGTVTAPTQGGLANEFLPAYGAAIGLNAPLVSMLLPRDASARLRSQRRGAVMRSVVNLVLATVFLLGALDRSRSKVLEREQAEIEMLTPRAAAASEYQARLAQLDIESAATRVSRPGAVSVLAAITRRLPRDATVMSVRADGDEWQVDGTAAAADRIVPALDADPLFENVRFLSATSRFTEGSRTYETFSVALHARR